jgi:hypothetical protein
MGRLKRKPMNKSSLSRREFLRLSSLGLGAAALRPWNEHPRFLQFPDHERLGRVVEEMDAPINLRVAPSSEAALAGEMMGDTVVPWLREVVGYTPYRNQRWVETPEGYIWSPLLQPVRNKPNQALDSLPDYGGGPGMWMEVTVPYVEAQLANASPRGFRIAYLVENSFPIRFYYGQVWWVDDLRTTEQGSEYHLRELYGSRGDEFWAPAEAFKPIYPEDAAHLSPEVEDKQIVINLARQTMSCFENGREIYFSRVSTGRFGEETETPPGEFYRADRKYLSIHMEGGATGAGYDLSGIGWVTFFITGGIAFHSTYWHNNFGEQTSAGCINLRPEDARFIYRWSKPVAEYYPGLVEQVAGTLVRVVEV